MNEAALIQAHPIPNNKQFEDFTGKIFGRLKVVSYAGKTSYFATVWNCKCECGAIRIVAAQKLKTGHTRSCGCLAREISAAYNTKHGFATGPKIGRRLPRTYVSWVSMKTRCLNPNDHAYPDYGGRGIVVCERWLKFENFLEDMGECPPRMTLERENNELGYSKDNCRWGTRVDQNNNKRNNRRVEFQGRTMTVAQWAKEFGISQGALIGRIGSGLL